MWYERAMTRDDVIATLKAAEPELRALGIARLSLFGSFARDEAGPDSDVDLIYAWAPENGRNAFRDYFAARRLLEKRLARGIDFASAESLHPMVRGAAVSSSVPVF